MTIEEAIEILNSCGCSLIIATAIDLAIEALEKQVAKKVIYTESNRPQCPNCARTFYYTTNPTCSDYCPECGQKLNWEEEK